MKFSGKFFGLLIIFGIAFLALVLVGTYLDAIDALSILVLFSPAKLGFGFVLGGIVLLTVGMVGIIRYYFENYRNLLSAFAILIIPALTFFTVLFVGSLVIIPFYFPLRSEITQVTVVDTSPLVLSVDVKAITSRDCTIEGANLMDSTGDNVIAYCSVKPFCELPAGSTRTLTLDFSEPFPSGDYIIRLTSWHNNHGNSPFNIP